MKCHIPNLPLAFIITSRKNAAYPSYLSPHSIQRFKCWLMIQQCYTEVYKKTKKTLKSHHKATYMVETPIHTHIVIELWEESRVQYNDFFSFSQLCFNLVRKTLEYMRVWLIMNLYLMLE